MANTCDREVWITIVERYDDGLEDRGYWTNRYNGSGPGHPVGWFVDGEVVDTVGFVVLKPNTEEHDGSWFGMFRDERRHGGLPRPQVAYCLPGLEAVDAGRSEVRPGGRLFFSGESRCAGFPEDDANWHYATFR